MPHLGVLGQHLAQVPLADRRALARGLDEMMRLEAADPAAERHRHRLGEDQPTRRLEVLGHPRGVELDSGQQLGEVRKRAGRERADLGQRFPFRVPVAEPALVLLDHRGQHHRDEPGHPDRRGEDRGRRTTGLRLCGIVEEPPFPAAAGSNASATSVCIEERDVAGDLAERADEQAERGRDLRDAVALRMPGHVGEREPEIRGERGCDSQPVLTERRQRPRGAAELQRKHARAQLADPRAVPLDGAQPTRRLQSEGDRSRLLQPGPAGEDGALVVPGERSEHAREPLRDPLR